MPTLTPADRATTRTARIRRISIAGIATAGAAAAALTLVPSPAQAAEPAAPKQAATAQKSYPDTLDGWIRESLDIMKAKGIPGTYEGLHRNIMRESSGNPEAVNGWDVNAQNGTPSKGLLQVIQPTFDTYHVAGTANDLTDPVANITAAANYAAATYGSIDNVDSAY
ncbi:transglycosylase SLT domain-containing protein [Streptomyces sp. NPDC052225]|uniref:transglycosylase SLT domain-containing protein n=1 Tax=Streptomyces sp. NPDC052225 TaxID=3154949 RepID=UPI00342E267E